jgi:hypothetical protein
MSTRIAAAEPGLTGIATPDSAVAPPSRVSWGAVLAGGVVAIAVGAMVNLLGLAVGATTLDPATPGESPSASTFALMGGIWLLLANLIGLAVGGWVAARLSGSTDDTDGVLHGLSVWAAGFLISVVVLGNVIAGTAATAGRTAGDAIGGAMGGVWQVAGQVTEAAAPQLRGLDPQALAERLQAALNSGGDPAAMSPDQRRAEMARLVTDRIGQGSFQGGQRDRLAALLAAETGVPAEQANARIAELEEQARQAAAAAETRAREAAEAAADATATGAYWFFGAMLLGAVAAVLGARLGTRRRVVVGRYA